MNWDELTWDELGWVDLGWLGMTGDDSGWLEMEWDESGWRGIGIDSTQDESNDLGSLGMIGMTPEKHLWIAPK